MDQELKALVRVAAAVEHFELVAKELSEEGKQHLISGLKLVIPSATTTASAAGQDTPAPGTIVTLPNISFLNPRGSYNVDFAVGFIELRGKKAGRIRIEANKVDSMQFLEREDALSLLLIQKQGADRDEENSIVISLKGLNSKANMALVQSTNDEVPPNLLELARNEKAQRHEVFAQWLAFAMQRLDQGPPKLENTGFVSAVNPKRKYVSCHSRNINEGKLFPLSTGMLFVGSGPFIAMPTLCSEILALNRSNSRMFELQVKVSGTKDLLLVFSSIMADEVPALQLYFKKTKFHEPSEEEEEEEESGEESEGSQGSGSEEDEEDSVFGSAASSSEGEDEGEGEEEEDETPRKRGRPPKKQKREEEEDEGSSEEEDDEDEDDKLKQKYDDVAEMVQETPFKPDAEDVIPDGRKRQRKVLPTPEDLM